MASAVPDPGSYQGRIRSSSIATGTLKPAGQSRSRKGTGKTTLELQTPTSNTGIYVGWNASWWDFGSPRQYPVLIHRNLSTGAQRR